MKIRGKLKAVLKKPFIFFSWHLSIYKGGRELRNINDGNKFIFVFSCGIGDIVWSSSFLQAYIEENNITGKILILCLKRDLRILQTYYPNFEYKCLGKEMLECVTKYSSIKRIENVKATIYPVSDIRKHIQVKSKCYADLGMEMDTCYKRGCFQLSDNVPLKKPDLSIYLDQALSIIREKHMPENKTVVLVPFINSRIQMPLGYWEKIADILIHLGYQVYTNISSLDGEYVKNTTPLYTSLEVLPLVIKYVGYAVSARCGLADWLYVNECRMSIIHTFKTDKTMSFDEHIKSKYGKLESFSDMGNRCQLKKILEYRIDVDDIKDSILMRIAKDVDYQLKEGEYRNAL